MDYRDGKYNDDMNKTGAPHNKRVVGNMEVSCCSIRADGNQDHCDWAVCNSVGALPADEQVVAAAVAEADDLAVVADAAAEAAVSTVVVVAVAVEAEDAKAAVPVSAAAAADAKAEAMDVEVEVVVTVAAVLLLLKVAERAVRVAAAPAHWESNQEASSNTESLKSFASWFVVFQLEIEIE